MSITINQERPDTKDAMALIEELDGILGELYAVESRHGYSVSKLVEQGVHFFVIRHDDQPAGCAGVQFFEANEKPPFGELKRMYVRPTFRGLGLAKALLGHIETVTAARGIDILRLETGIYQTEAIGLYERNGFKRIPPFADYWDDPVSHCYEKQIVLNNVAPVQ